MFGSTRAHINQLNDRIGQLEFILCKGTHTWERMNDGSQYYICTVCGKKISRMQMANE